MSASTLHGHGFLRFQAASFPLHLANPLANANRVLETARLAAAVRVDALVFPALTLTGVSAGDLLGQAPLLDSVLDALEVIRKESAQLDPVLAVGAPLRVSGNLLSCAVLIHRGAYLAVIPQDSPWPLGEFATDLAGFTVPFGDIRFSFRGFGDLSVRVVIGDLPAADADSATVILGLGDAPALAGQGPRREERLRATSSERRQAVITANPGWGESTNDTVWDGQTLIVEDGRTLASGPRFSREIATATADVDIQALLQLRLLSGQSSGPVNVVVEPGQDEAGELLRKVDRFPFGGTPAEEIIIMQGTALAQRMVSIGNPKLILGVSGGLDSTIALLAACAALDSLGRPRTDLLGYTMPGFGTSSATRAAAEELCRACGVTFAELDIRPAATAMLEALGHPYSAGQAQYDVTFENVQAGLRTDYLFRLANQEGCLVVGTGDLSELALGWCTYGVGDQMSHYGVNAGLPKTVIQEVLREVSEDVAQPDDLRSVLKGILDTEISPELIPADGGSTQSTESAIGPYELQDFTLYHVLRFGFGPKKIFYLSQQAWGEKYTDSELARWLGVFFRRFFSSQFKREAAPNAPRIMSAGSLSPRGGWQMPSDASSAVWLAEVAELEELTK